MLQLNTLKLKCMTYTFRFSIESRIDSHLHEPHEIMRTMRFGIGTFTRLWYNQT